MFNIFNINKMKAFASENKQVFYSDTEIVQLPNGKFQMLSDNNVVYEGEMKGDKKHGEGAEYFDYKKGYASYVGNYENDKCNGYGQRYVLRNDKPVLIEDGIFKNGYFHKGKQYLDGKLEYDGEVETINNLAKMDKDERNKARKDNHYSFGDSDDYDRYRIKTRLEYLYHGKGSKYTPGESQPNFVGNFDRGEPTFGKVFYNSSAFTKNKLRQLQSYKQSNKPVDEKEQDIQKTENKYKNHHIKMGKKKMNIKKDNYGNQKVEHFVEVDKKLGNTDSKYKLYKVNKGINKGKFEHEIKYNNGLNSLNNKQYLLAKNIKGIWNVPQKKDIVFKENANGNTKSIEINEEMAQGIAKFI